MVHSSLDLTLVRHALVIDDERAVRVVLRRWLNRHGWDVVEAPDGEAALACLRERPPSSPSGSFDVVICDLRMPSLSGPELHAWAAEHRPELLPRIVFASGDVQERAAADFLERCGCPVLEKPFELVQLEAVISSIVPVRTT